MRYGTREKNSVNLDGLKSTPYPQRVQRVLGNVTYWHTCSCRFNQLVTIGRLDYGLIKVLAFAHTC
jgi:hypothetical protein